MFSSTGVSIKPWNLKEELNCSQKSSFENKHVDILNSHVLGREARLNLVSSIARWASCLWGLYHCAFCILYAYISRVSNNWQTKDFKASVWLILNSTKLLQFKLQLFKKCCFVLTGRRTTFNYVLRKTKDCVPLKQQFQYHLNWKPQEHTECNFTIKSNFTKGNWKRARLIQLHINIS